MRPITVTVAQLRSILADITHATPFSATTLTDAKAKKTDNPLGTVYKLTRVNGMVGTHYGSAVERQQGREGVDTPSFTPQPRSWGERIAPALVRNGDTFYLPAQLNPTIKPKPLYLIRDQFKGRLTSVPKEKVAPWLPADRGTAKAEAQGVEREVVYRDYRLDSLISLSINGRKYRVRHAAP